LISASVCRKIKSKGVYIGVFRSKGVYGRRELGKRSHRALDGPTMQPEVLPVWWPYLGPPRPSPLLLLQLLEFPKKRS
jgi:hypothetical protein